MMQLTQRQADNWATVPRIVLFAIAMIPIGLLSVGCAFMYSTCCSLIEQGQSLMCLFTGSGRAEFLFGAAFALGGLLFGTIVLYMFFGIETWAADGESLSRNATLFGVAVRKREWRFSDIDNPQLNHITGERIDTSRPFGSRGTFGSHKSHTDEWEVSVRNKATRKSERIYWSGTQKRAEEFFDFLRSTMLLRTSDE